VHRALERRGRVDLVEEEHQVNGRALARAHLEDDDDGVGRARRLGRQRVRGGEVRELLLGAHEARGAQRLQRYANS
jgi:hypothetical protein